MAKIREHWSADSRQKSDLIKNISIMHLRTEDALHKCKKEIELLKENMGVIDVLIYNPGLKTPSVLNTDIMDIKLEDFHAAHALFCAGALLCVQQVLPDMVAKEGDGTTTKQGGRRHDDEKRNDPVYGRHRSLPWQRERCNLFGC